MCKIVSAIHKNAKTIRSIDISTACPLRGTDKQCPYCYVEEAREIECNAKLVHEECEYKGELRKLRPATLEVLRAVGLRMFSFGDYRGEKDDAKLETILADCVVMNIPVKVITKQIDFIKKYHNHPAIVVINLSIDNMIKVVDHEEAKQIREKYGKVRIRCVAATLEDIKHFHTFVDVITIYHGNKMIREGKADNFNKRAIKAEGTALAGDKMCCSTGRCATCTLKCGM